MGRLKLAEKSLSHLMDVTCGFNHRNRRLQWLSFVCLLLDITVTGLGNITSLAAARLEVKHWEIKCLLKDLWLQSVCTVEICLAQELYLRISVILGSLPL